MSDAVAQAEEVARQAETLAVDARRELDRIRQGATERADRFASITTASAMDPAQIRELADQVRLADPAAQEAAAITAARAELHAVQARHAVLDAARPGLEAEAARLRGIADEAQKAWQAANIAACLTLPIYNNTAGELRQASQAVQGAEQAAREGAERRLAHLMGTTPATPAQEIRNDLGQTVTTTRYAAR